MDLYGLSFLTEEAVLSNGVIYDAVILQEEGYRHYQISCISGESPDELIEDLKRDLGLENIAYVPNRELKNVTSKGILEENVLANDDSFTLMQQLYEIEKLGTIELDHLSSEGCRINYYPKYLIYEVNNMAVKLPKQIIHDIEGTKYTYEYLIYPNFTVNTELLNELRHLTGKDLPLNVEGVQGNIYGRGFIRPFSINLHKKLYTMFFEQCELSKGITNAIRIMDFNKIAEDTLYDLYQNFRAHKKDSISYIGYEYYGPLEELTITEILKRVDMTQAQAATISQDQEARIAFVEKHKDDPAYVPIIEFIEGLSSSPFDAMKAYHEMEEKRCYIRKLIYQLNMCWYDDFPETIKYIASIQPGFEFTDVEYALALAQIYWFVDNRAWGISRCEFDGKRHRRK